MKIIKFLLIGFTVLNLVGCVSQKKFLELEDEFGTLQRVNTQLNRKLDDCNSEKTALEDELSYSKDRIEVLKTQRDDLTKDLQTTKSTLEKLNDSYDALEQNSSQALAANSKQNRELLEQLELKEGALAEEQNRLEQLQKDLQARSNQIEELQSLIADKEQKMISLKENLSRALTNFEGQGLSVELRDGKVYVSMENKLLFASGSWTVGGEGQKAVKELGKVLADNPDIAVLIEGHTDNVPYGGNGPLTDNWDLSTKRATEVLKLLLKNGKINPQNLTAAGKGEFAPLVPNTTEEGKAKNRRIEVVLTPKLDEISKLLSE
ncbi:peptidoglycan-binding lipoprotein ion transport porin, OmpA family [Psychroflexus torquis ATCC 700755]|uniref:Peptidoglycan-binding lipoprotein ion transport porin, OmpA family n=1 Tax=Psychroflexus torquis (strain ATCC 700755 / CIP 106069 / ACAM 623) TaxID=313595 RepID=K4IBQ4_PSYTT|nr:flagellar motor protein MotB [Psychroflexus torquis]AFU68022.1 peptidoglycan-binding lipoprotein ion transport porin, OmpA family [Psychroflexus torquis ATCC 700755]